MFAAKLKNPCVLDITEVCEYKKASDLLQMPMIL